MILVKVRYTLNLNDLFKVSCVYLDLFLVVSTFSQLMQLAINVL